MTSLLGSISGQFAKPVVFGMLFPVLITAALNAALVVPVLPIGPQLEPALRRIALGEQSAWKVVALSFFVLFITGLLYALNIPIIRLYEGYGWRDSWIGTWLANRQRDRYTATVTIRAAIRGLARQLRMLDPTDPQLPSLRGKQTALARSINSDWPDRDELVLPTRLGNTIRSFERYPFRAYGMDTIVLWPRLVAKIESGFAATIDEAKSAFDFMLNCSVLTGITALVLVVLASYRIAPLGAREDVLWRALVFGAMSVAFYRLSISRAVAWGLQVRSAFDLYRGELLKALGYARMPAAPDEEQMMWQTISNQLLYADAIDAPLAYADPPARAVVFPPTVAVEVTRTLESLEPNGTIRVRIVITNTDPRRRAVERLRLIDTLPEGHPYIADSVWVSRGQVVVAAMKPLQLVLDPLPPAGQLVVNYAVRPAA